MTFPSLCLLRLLAQLLLRTQCSSSLNCLVIYGTGEYLKEVKAIGEEYQGSLGAGIIIGNFSPESIFIIRFDTALLLIYDTLVRKSKQCFNIT